MALWLTSGFQLIKIAKSRYNLCVSIVICLTVLILLRLTYLQIIQAPIYQLLAEDNIASFKLANFATSQQQAEQLMLARQAAILAAQNIDITTLFPVWQNEQQAFIDSLIFKPALSMQQAADKLDSVLTEPDLVTIYSHYTIF